MRHRLLALLLLLPLACSDTDGAADDSEQPSYETQWRDATAIYQAARARVDGRLETPAEYPELSRDSMEFERDDAGEWMYSQPPVMIFVDSANTTATVLGEYATIDRRGKFTVRLNRAGGEAAPRWEPQAVRPDFSDVDLTE